MANLVDSSSQKVLLYEGFVNGNPFQILTDSAGKVHAYVGEIFLPVLGIPQEIDRRDNEALEAAQVFLSNANIKDFKTYLIVTVKLFGGWNGGDGSWPPLPQGNQGQVIRMSDEERLAADALLEQVLGSVPGKLVSLGSVPIPGLGLGAAAGAALIGFITDICCKGFISYNNKVSAKSKIANLDTKITALETDFNNNKIGLTDLYNGINNLTKNSLKDRADTDVAVKELYTSLNKVKSDLEGATPPGDADTIKTLATLSDLVNIASEAIFDKKTAQQVRLVGQATISFGRAFHAACQIGSVATAGLSAIANPLGFALSGVSAIYTLFSSTDSANPSAAVEDQIRVLSTQLDDLEKKLDVRFDQLEKTLSDFRLETLDNFKKLAANINLLRQQSQAYFLSTQTKLDRIANNISRGFMAMQLSKLNAIIYRAYIRKREGTLTPDRKDDLLIDLAQWAVVQSKNGIFSGMLNVNTQMPTTYDVQNVYDVLSTHSELELMGYLSNYPRVNPSVREGLDLLASPSIWANAADNYISILDDVLVLDTGKILTFKDIYKVGQDLNAFIAKLQKDSALFAGLIDDYKTALEELLSLPFNQLQAALQPGSANRNAIALDAYLLLIRAFCKLAFNRSCNQDLIFSSLLFGNSFLGVHLMTSKNIRDYLATLGVNPDRERLSAIFLVKASETCDYLNLILQQKMVQSNDTHLAINAMVQILWLFGNSRIPVDPLFALGTFPVNAPLNQTNLTKITLPLGFAVQTGNTAWVQANANSANVKNVDRLGMTPLHHACLTDQPTLVNTFIGLGADVSAGDNQGFTPLHYLNGPSRQAIADELGLAGASSYRVNFAGHEPLIKPLKSPLLQQLTNILSKAVNYKKTFDLSSPFWGWTLGAFFTHGQTLILSVNDFVERNLSTDKTLPLKGGRVKSVYKEKMVYQKLDDLIVIDNATGTSTTVPTGLASGTNTRIALTDKYIFSCFNIKLINHIKIWELSTLNFKQITLSKVVSKFTTIDNDRVFIQFTDRTVSIVDAVTATSSPLTGNIATHSYSKLSYLQNHSRVVALEDPTTVAAGSSSPTPLHIWESSTGNPIATLTAHTAPVIHLIVANNLFVSIDNTWKTIVWNAAGGVIRQKVLPLKPYLGAIPPKSSVRLMGEEALLYLDPSGQLMSWDFLNDSETTLLSTKIPFLAFEVHKTLLATISDSIPLKRLDVYKFNNPMNCETYGPYSWS